MMSCQECDKRSRELIAVRPDWQVCNSCFGKLNRRKPCLCGRVPRKAYGDTGLCCRCWYKARPKQPKRDRVPGEKVAILFYAAPALKARLTSLAVSSQRSLTSLITEALLEFLPPVTEIRCFTCGKVKAPIGRSVPDALAADLCNHGCSGYTQDPQPKTTWPGEAT